jgi:beta-phosphoglucomutase
MDSFAVIFDMNGVMVDDNRYHKLAWKCFCKKYGFQMSDRELKENVYGKTNEAILTFLFGKRLSKKDLVKFANEKESLYRREFGKVIRPVAGLKSFLEELKRNGIVCAVATSSPPANVRFVVGRLKLKDFFTVIVDERLVKKGKPEPEIYVKTAKLLGMSCQNCVVFEDSLSGVAAARAAGMKVVGVMTTHKKREFTGVVGVIPNFTGLNVKKLKKIILLLQSHQPYGRMPGQD